MRGHSQLWDLLNADSTQLFLYFACKRSLVRIAEALASLEILIMEIARDLFTVPARSRSGSSRLYSEFPAFSAGAGTWVCGSRKTTQMVPVLLYRCKWISTHR